VRTRTARLALAALAITLLAAACGGDDDDDAADTTTTTEATTTTVDKAADEAAAGQVAVDFFAAFHAQDTTKTEALLENGASHTAQILHCANLATAFTGIDLKTVVVDGDTATLTYDIVGPDGNPLVEGSQGTALRVGDKWILSETTFLSLYDAAKDGCTGPPPPAG